MIKLRLKDIESLVQYGEAGAQAWGDPVPKFQVLNH